MVNSGEHVSQVSGLVTAQNDIFQWEYNYYKIKQEDMENNKRRAMMEEMKECTFDPAIAGPRLPRSFSNFLHEQNKHFQRREQTLTDLRSIMEEKESRKHTNAPQISEVPS